MKFIQKAIIRKDNKFLIMLRSPNAKYFPEHWDFPGGTLEADEDPFSGVERELLEETSLKIKALEVVGSYELDLDNAGKYTHRFTLYSAQVLSGEVTLSNEHLKFQWATQDEIFHLKTEPYIQLYFNEREKKIFSVNNKEI